MMIKRFMFSVASLTLAVAFGGTPVEIKNSSFELSDANGAATGWIMPKKHWKVVRGAGSNGSSGLVFEGDDPNSRDWPYQYITVESGKRYRLSANMKADGLTCPKMGRWAGLSIYIEWFDKSGKLTGCIMTYCVNGKTDWVHRENITPVVAPGVAKCRIVPLVIKGGVGRAVIDDISLVEIEERPVSGVWSSAYRNEQAEGKVAFAAGLHVPSGTDAGSLKAVFSFPGSDGRRKEIPAVLSDGDAHVQVDVSELALGTNDVVCTLFSSERKLGSDKLAFARLAKLPPRRVRFDSQGRTLVEGKKFMPLGLYVLEIDRENIDIIAKSPFNCIMSYKFPTTDADLDLCHEKGLKVLYDVRRKTDTIYDDEIGRSWMKKRIPEVRTHPSILAWYSDDESAPTLVPRLKGRYKLLTELDGDHPVWAVQDKHGSRLRDYMGTFDVFGTDPYPVSRYPIGDVAMHMRSDRKAVFGLRPVWQVPQGFGWGRSRGDPNIDERQPTPEEVANMAWQSIACGANGLVFFRYHQLREKVRDNAAKWWSKIWPGLIAVGRDLRRFERVILGDSAMVPAGAPPELAIRSWRVDGEDWLLLVNTTTNRLSCALDLPAKGVDWKIELGPSALKVNKNGKLSVDLPALGVVMAKAEKMGTDPKKVGTDPKRTIENLAYDDSGRPTSAGDLFLPDKVDHSTPVVLVIHGGGWHAMRRQDVQGIAEFFRDKLGFAAYNIDYRLASAKARWPACGDDCVKAAKFILSEKFKKISGLDPRKVWVCGGSAGGHLTLWTAMSLPKDQVAGAIAISPIGDPRVDFADYPKRYEYLFGKDAESRLAEMDPCRLAVKPGPPILITHSKKDRVVRIESARAFKKAYEAAGGPCRMYEYDPAIEPNTGGHAIWRQKINNPRRLSLHLEKNIEDFVRSYHRR